MNKSFFIKKENKKSQWHVIDASDQILGRLASKVADILRGKDKPEYTPHADSGDYVIVTNCEKIILTGNKWEDKIYRSYSGWKSGLKERSATEVFQKDPTLLFKYAVKGMLPKNKLSRGMIKKLKIYSGNEHPHTAQIATFSSKK
ncbi:50S ribosomal protein L13 [Candidatus Dependentiae bacterium]|nr:50S ribosomal protein L13 [Candidatus Dependentiae bacterium]